jgi:hypothetical protein
MLHWAEATFEKALAGQAETSLTAEVQVINFGQAALVGVSGELFSSLGQAIKAGSQGSGLSGQANRTLLISGYTNGDVGYLPPRQEYARGGYEIAEAYRYYGYPAALAPEAGEMIVEAAIRCARQ